MQVKSGLIDAWLSKAKVDEDSFYYLMESDKHLEDAAAFHAQQCVEKWLITLMILNDITPPKVHDILLLVIRLSLIYPELNEIKWDNASRLLNEYAVNIRYHFEFTFLQNTAPNLALINEAVILF